MEVKEEQMTQVEGAATGKPGKEKKAAQRQKGNPELDSDHCGGGGGSAADSHIPV